MKEARVRFVVIGESDAVKTKLLLTRRPERQPFEAELQQVRDGLRTRFYTRLKQAVIQQNSRARNKIEQG